MRYFPISNIANLQSKESAIVDYQTIKWIHILSSTILFGTGIGTAFFMLMANRSKKLTAIVFATKTVVIADFIFTAPSVIVQLLSGLYLVQLGGHLVTSTWIIYGLGLYFFAGACWLPVVWMQIKMRDFAIKAKTEGSELGVNYWRFEKAWTLLGALAFPAIVIVFWLMVNKPN